MKQDAFLRLLLLVFIMLLMCMDAFSQGSIDTISREEVNFQSPLADQSEVFKVEGNYHVIIDARHEFFGDDGTYLELSYKVPYGLYTAPNSLVTPVHNPSGSWVITHRYSMLRPSREIGGRWVPVWFMKKAYVIRVQ